MPIIKDKQTLDDSLNMRVNSIVLKEFQEKSREVGKASQELIREFMKAFNEGRLNIQLSESQKEIYNVNRK